MKVSSATDSNNNSLTVEDEERATSSGVEIIATEESSSFNATAVDRAAAPKRKTTNKFYIAVGSLVVAAGVLGIASFAGSSIHSSKQQVAALNNVVEEGYEFVAVGLCLDFDGNGVGNRYDYIAFYVSSLQACGERCSGCPGNNADIVLLGFSYGVGGEVYGSTLCECHVDDGASQDTLDGAGCEDVVEADAGNEGSGEIQGAIYNDYFVCYKKRKGGKSKSSKRGKANNEARGM